MQRFAIFYFLLTFIACGKNSIPPEGFTKISYSNESDDKSIQATLSKGMMVYALNTSNGRMGAKYAPNIGQFLLNNQEVFLPNGDYRFFSIGYDSGTTGPAIAGDFFCGDGNNGELIQLNGGTKTVNIVLHNTAASNSGVCQEAFAAPSHRNGNLLKNLRVQLCTGAVQPGCSGAYPTNSFRIVIGEYDGLFNGPLFNYNNSIKSCHPKIVAGAKDIADHFPMRLPFRFRLESFNNVDCTGIPSRSVLFEHGIEGTNNNPDRYIDNTNASYVEIGIGV